MTCNNRRERAQSMVEFAVALPIFLVLMLGIVDFSRLLFAYVTLANGAREMARALSIPSTTSTAAIQRFANTVVMTGPVNNSADTVTVTVTPSTGSATSVTCYLNTNSTGITLTTRGTSSACSLPSRSGADDGTVDVAVSYSFQFTPVFQAPLGVGFGANLASVKTTARAYVE